MVDELLYADGKNCPLLKKAAVDKKLDESPQLRKEMVKEMTKAFASHKKRKRD